MARQDLSREIFGRIEREPDFALIILPNSDLLRGINRVRSGLLQERRTGLGPTK